MCRNFMGDISRQSCGLKRGYHLIQRVAGVAFLLMFTARGWSQAALPTIKVVSGFKVHHGESPSDEVAEAFFDWSSTNADHVLIIGYDNERHPSKGHLDVGGSYIFVAVGAGGRASQSAGAFPMGKPGPGRHGLVYDFDDQFRAPDFFRYAAKSATNGVAPDEINRRLLAEMQRMGYTVAVEQPRSIEGSVLYTLNYEFNDLVKPPSDEKGKVQRQIGFVAHVGPDLVDKKSAARWLYIQPLVQKNYPRDNDKWTIDPDGLQLGMAACRKLAESVLLAREERVKSK
jgi:hypothetical protein